MYRLKNHYHCYLVLSYRHIYTIHSWVTKIYWSKKEERWLHSLYTFFTVKNLRFKITSAVQMLSDAELLTKYLHEPNFVGYYSQNIHFSKHMVPLKVTFLLPRNAGLIIIGNQVHRIPQLATEPHFYRVWIYKEMLHPKKDWSWRWS